MAGVRARPPEPGDLEQPGQRGAHEGAGDCWDAPDDTAPADGFVVVPEDVSGTAWVQPLPSEVHPGVVRGGTEPEPGGLVDTWYDGVDQDCAGNDDFDADADGFRSSSNPDATGAVGDDCDDGGDSGASSEAEWEASAAVNPAADEIWYDGIDQDCDFENTVDCDQDGDGYRADPTSIADLDASPARSQRMKPSTAGMTTPRSFRTRPSRRSPTTVRTTTAMQAMGTATRMAMATGPSTMRTNSPRVG